MQILQIMNSLKDSPSVIADKKRMQWVQHQWRMLQEEEKIDNINGEIIERFLNSLILNNVKRPDVFTVWSGSIRRALEEEVRLPLTSHVQLIIKRWAAANARERAGSQLYEPTQAVAISKEKVSLLISHLWFKKWTNLSFKQSAVICYICANTGARAKEVIDAYIEDLEWHTDGDMKFLRIPLRQSKGNAFKTRREALVLPLTSDTESSFQHWLKVILKGRTAGKIFLKASTAKLREHFKSAGKALNWPEVPTAHSMRAHFVVEALRAGASESDIIANCRWKDQAMINIYRMRQLECTKQGPAFRIFESKTKAGHESAIPLAPVKDSSTVPTVQKIKIEPGVVDLTTSCDEPAQKVRLEPRADGQMTLKLPASSPKAEVVRPPPPVTEVPTLSPEAYKSWEAFFAKKDKAAKRKKGRLEK